MSAASTAGRLVGAAGTVTRALARALAGSGIPVAAGVTGLVAVVALSVAPASPAGATTVVHRFGASAAPGLSGDPAGLVDPLDGTGAGPVSPGAIAEFPGADLPFGMIQWSPDTVPNAEGSGGGYSYADSRINGFSLTHLSGVGCPAYGDVPILPTVGPVGTSPVSASDSFSHTTEEAAPGRYGVTLGSPGITTRLAVTTRTGISSFTFPSTDSANVLVKVADSANPVVGSRVQIVGDHQLTGQVTSGQFCSTGTNYTVYFAATFDRPFIGEGSWSGSTVTPGRATCSGTACGAYVTFDTRTDPVVLMKVGISFVSVRDAAANLADEDPGWSLDHVEHLATRAWNSLLDRARVGGGTPAQQRTFTTALYHSLLFPNVVSDADGRYVGSDGRLHRAVTGAHYSNFSEWDIYRSQIELVSLLAPDRAGAMVQSLVDDADQGGWLPKWAIVDGDASQMNGDSADPIIAAAYAFGARGFDVKAALAAMVKGATQNETGHGFEIERQYLSQYLGQHYIDAGELDLSSIDYSLGASATLEYAIDDFSIAQMARVEEDGSLYRSMMARAHNWQYLFNPATGFIEGRNDDGSFPAGPAFQSDLFEDGGEVGFEEGNAVQYTWSVPQDLSALSSLMGGDAAAVRTLDTYFTQLNAGRFEPYDWAGNEPSLWTPWEYDYFGAPSHTQAVVRSIADTLYADAPDDEPGNDDLGAISSWYVWAALGIYPVTPGRADLALASPLFPLVDITLPDGRHLVMHSPSASASTPYVDALTVTGAGRPDGGAHCTSTSAAAGNWCQPWLPASILTSGGTLSFRLSSVSDPTWAASPSAAPPSYATGRLPVVGYSRPTGRVVVAGGTSATVALGVQPAEPVGTTVVWDAIGSGATVAPASGRFVVGPPHQGVTVAPPTRALLITSSMPGSHLVEIHMKTTTGIALPSVVIEVAPAT
jgi:predicted alpha-1,2-mannosidase